MSRYPALMAVSGFVLVAGWCGVILGVIFVVWGLIDVATPSSGFGPPVIAGLGFFKIIAGIGFASFGIVQLLVAETVKVFLGIEANTVRIIALLGEGLPETVAPSPASDVPATWLTSEQAACLHGDLEVASDTEYRCRVCGVLLS